MGAPGAELNPEEAYPTVRVVLPGDGDVTAKFGGRVLYDMSLNSADRGLKRFAGSSADEMFFDNAEFRAARFFVKGTLYDAIDYKVNYDFAGGSVGFKDVWMETPLGCGKIRAGHFFEPFGLEANTSSKYTTFTERGLTSTFAPSRNGGLMFYNKIDGDTDWSWAVAATKDAGSNGDYGGKTSGAYNLTGRATVAPTNNKETGDLLHFGLSYSVRGDVDGEVRFRARPENHAVPRIADTRFDGNDIASDGYSLGGAEFVWGTGPFSIQAEYMTAMVDGRDGSTNPTFTSYYSGFSYFLTGEHRNYKNGTFGGVTPNGNYGQGGKGAVELTARYSYLDLNDGGIYGGELTDTTVGVNWYLNPNTRLMFNYIMADLKDRALPAPAMAMGDGELDAAVLRFQFSF